MPTSGGKSVNYYSNGKMKGMHITPQVKAARLSTVRMARDDDDKKVNVNLIPDVDSFTLTSVGFGLIAFNFLILANVSCHLGTVLIRFLHLLMIPFIYLVVYLLNKMGDMGLAGIVARIMNIFG